MFVDERKTEYRREILEFLAKKGYGREKSEFRSEEEIIASVLPIAVDMENKTYRMMGNVTCAAAAASSGGLKSREQFYQCFTEE